MAKVREGDQFHVPVSDPVQRWHELTRNPLQDRRSRGSAGQIKQDVAKQHHQLHMQVRVISILLYVCEAWTLLADSEERSQAFETKCLRKRRISYLEHKTND